MPAQAKLHELGACAGHRQIAAGEHERLGLLARAVHVQAHLLEGHGAAVGRKRVAFGRRGVTRLGTVSLY